MTDIVLDTTQCDTYGHAWIETMDSTWRSELGVPLTLICERCTDQRWDVVNPKTGELICRRYVKHQGYTPYKRNDRPSRSDFRRRLLATKMKEAREMRKRQKNAS